MFTITCIVSILLSPLTLGSEEGDENMAATPLILTLEDIPHLHKYKYVDRGPEWYGYSSNSIGDSDSDVKSYNSDESRFSSTESDSESSSTSSEASSRETDEKDLKDKLYRECVPCVNDMLRKHTNIGIHWICGGYQRARRTFKSECMMRYRNCQDGTMFVKLYDHRCANDTYHGVHWFYIYKV